MYFHKFSVLENSRKVFEKSLNFTQTCLYEPWVSCRQYLRILDLMGVGEEVKWHNYPDNIMMDRSGSVCRVFVNRLGVERSLV